MGGFEDSPFDPCGASGGIIFQFTLPLRLIPPPLHPILMSITLSSPFLEGLIHFLSTLLLNSAQIPASPSPFPQTHEHCKVSLT